MRRGQGKDKRTKAGASLGCGENGCSSQLRGPRNDGTMSASRPRNFRPDLPLTRKSGRLKVHTEDAALTRYLVRALKEARSFSLKPPACPYCRSRLTILAGRPHARMPMPAFQCNSCSRRFNRLTGTLLARLQHADKALRVCAVVVIPNVVQGSCRDPEGGLFGYRQLGRKVSDLLLELDPSGAWEARVRLGIKPRPLVPCPNCGKDAHVRFFGFHQDRRTRRLVCRACLVTWALSTTQGEAGLPLQTTVAYDPRVSRLRRDCERR
jgi:transposase-like protein